MPIACVYCGGSHETTTEVRACWQRSGDDAAGAGVVGRDAAIDEPPTSRPAGGPDPLHGVSTERSERVAGNPATAPALRPRAARVATPCPVGRGPASLGRHVLVEPGAAAPVGWDDAERVAIGASVLDGDEDEGDDGLLGRLRSAWDAGRSLVIELEPAAAERLLGASSGSAPPVPVERTSVDPHELGPRFGFRLDHLAHLAATNAVDCRRPDQPRWWVFEQAIALGASPAADPELADVVLPDGRPVWLDGGPPRRRAPIEGVAVLHAVSVEHGSLVPPEPTDADETELAPDQAAAVGHDAGSARIIAPAGSGKTRVLTERARRLVTSWRVPASAIGLVAFNARAQQEMGERTSDLAGLQIRTLNSIALAVLNGTRPFAPRPRSVRTITEPDVRRILDRLVRVRRLRNTDPMAAWIEALGLIRLGLVSPSEVEARYDGEVDGLTEVWPRYRAELDRDGVVDFDGQIHGALEVLLGDPAARAAAQRVCRHLLVDEFQDLTPAHVLLIRLLAGPGGSVFGVGDDDQTIYGYNGADPGWLIDFASIFPGAASHPLEVNYRCPPDVVDAADRLLRHNRRRVPKQIRAAPGRAADTAGWSVVTSDDPVSDTVEQVRRLVEQGVAPSDIAVLTRVNVVLAPVQVGLRDAGVPVSRAIGTELLDRTAVRALLAWLRLSEAGPGDPGDPGGRGAGVGRFRSDDIAEALRRPSRSLRPNVAEWAAEQSDIAGLRRLAGRLNDDTSAGRVDAFADDLELLCERAAGGATTAELVATVIDRIGLAGAVSRLDDHRRGMNRPAQGDDLHAMQQLARSFDRAAGAGTTDLGFEAWLRAWLSVPGDPDGVTLATVHRVKGQEWPHVLVHLAERSQFPHLLADDPEEERRVFHVGLTRASTHVTLVTGPEPSSFVAELTAEPPDRPDTDASIPSPGDRSARSRTRTERGGSADRGRQHPLLDRATVIVGVGMTLVDQGRDWRVVEVGRDDLLAEGAGGVTRRFGFGRPVRSIGGQQGRPRPAVEHDATEEGAPGVEPVAAVLYDELRRWRQLARDGKPAYTVFDDRTLVAIAETRPTDLRALGAVRGVGPAKLERYGDAVIEVVTSVSDAVGPGTGRDA